MTLPGHGGTPPPDDFSIENYARLTANLAADLGCDVVLGFSIGATVAIEMVVSGAFSGPVVLLGPSVSAKDEPAFFRAIDRLGVVFGSLPCAALRTMMGLVTKQARVSPSRRAEILADLRKNEPKVMRQIFHNYLNYLRWQHAPAERLGDAGVPAWMVHAEKGDGGLTNEERRTLEASPFVTLVSIPGTSYFIPNDEPGRVADILVEVIGRADRLGDRWPAVPST